MARRRSDNLMFGHTVVQAINRQRAGDTDVIIPAHTRASITRIEVEVSEEGEDVGDDA